jgi:type II secretory pathway pseudopilin PulG
MKRAHIIEAVVAFAVVTILFVVMLPKFNNAQVRTRITQARQDLTTLIGAMDAYSIDWPSAVVRTLTMDGGNYPNMTVRIQILKELDQGDPLWHILTFNQTAFSGYLETIPKPQPYFRLPSHKERNGGYSIQWHGHENSSIGDEFGVPGFTGYIATALCPAIRESGASDGDDAGFYYVEYDVSNGLVSHGFTVVRTPSVVTPDISAFDRRVRKWWREQASQQP